MSEFHREQSIKEEGNYNDVQAEVCPQGRFIRFNEELGFGAYKTVYRAYDNDSGCEVAWNVIKTQRIPVYEPKRIQEEISLLKNLHHENIMNFICAWVNQQKNEVIFITECLLGGSLKAHLNKIKKPLLKVIKKWCRQILSGLQYLHEQKPHPVIHRDMKCQNVFISTTNNEIRIGDLGLAVALKNSSHTTSVLGTPEFMAPEIYEGKYGTPVDIYSFGMCLLEMATNCTPYSECTSAPQIYRKVSQGVLPIQIDMIADQNMKSVILRCLQAAQNRPSAEELLKDPFFDPKISTESDKYPVQLVTNLNASANTTNLKSTSSTSKTPAQSATFDSSSKTTLPNQLPTQAQLKSSIASSQIQISRPPQLDKQVLTQKLLKNRNNLTIDINECENPSTSNDIANPTEKSGIIEEQIKTNAAQQQAGFQEQEESIPIVLNKSQNFKSDENKEIKQSSSTLQRPQEIPQRNISSTQNAQKPLKPLSYKNRVTKQLLSRSQPANNITYTIRLSEFKHESYYRYAFTLEISQNVYPFDILVDQNEVNKHEFTRESILARITSSLASVESPFSTNISPKIAEDAFAKFLEFQARKSRKQSREQDNSVGRPPKKSIAENSSTSAAQQFLNDNLQHSCNSSNNEFNQSYRCKTESANQSESDQSYLSESRAHHTSMDDSYEHESNQNFQHPSENLELDEGNTIENTHAEDENHNNESSNHEEQDDDDPIEQDHEEVDYNHDQEDDADHDANYGNRNDQEDEELEDEEVHEELLESQDIFHNYVEEYGDNHDEDEDENDIDDDESEEEELDPENDEQDGEDHEDDEQEEEGNEDSELEELEGDNEADENEYDDDDQDQGLQFGDYQIDSAYDADCNYQDFSMHSQHLEFHTLRRIENMNSNKYSNYKKNNSSHSSKKASRALKQSHQLSSKSQHQSSKKYHHHAHANQKSLKYQHQLLQQQQLLPSQQQQPHSSSQKKNAIQTQLSCSSNHSANRSQPLSQQQSQLISQINLKTQPSMNSTISQTRHSSFVLPMAHLQTTPLVFASRNPPNSFTAGNRSILQMNQQQQLTVHSQQMQSSSILNNNNSNSNNSNNPHNIIQQSSQPQQVSSQQGNRNNSNPPSQSSQLSSSGQPRQLLQTIPQINYSNNSSSNGISEKWSNHLQPQSFYLNRLIESFISNIKTYWDQNFDGMMNESQEMMKFRQQKEIIELQRIHVQQNDLWLQQQMTYTPIPSSSIYQTQFKSSDIYGFTNYSQPHQQQRAPPTSKQNQLPPQQQSQQHQQLLLQQQNSLHNSHDLMFIPVQNTSQILGTSQSVPQQHASLQQQSSISNFTYFFPPSNDIDQARGVSSGINTHGQSQIIHNSQLLSYPMNPSASKQQILHQQQHQQNLSLNHNHHQQQHSNLLQQQLQLQQQQQHQQQHQSQQTQQTEQHPHSELDLSNISNVKEETEEMETYHNEMHSDPHHSIDIEFSNMLNENTTTTTPTPLHTHHRTNSNNTAGNSNTNNNRSTNYKTLIGQTGVIYSPISSINKQQQQLIRPPSQHNLYISSQLPSSNHHNPGVATIASGGPIASTVPTALTQSQQSDAQGIRNDSHAHIQNTHPQKTRKQRRPSTSESNLVRTHPSNNNNNNNGNNYNHSAKTRTKQSKKTIPHQQFEQTSSVDLEDPYAIQNARLNRQQKKNSQTKQKQTKQLPSFSSSSSTSSISNQNQMFQRLQQPQNLQQQHNQQPQQQQLIIQQQQQSQQSQSHQVSQQQPQQQQQRQVPVQPYELNKNDINQSQKKQTNQASSKKGKPNVAIPLTDSQVKLSATPIPEKQPLPKLSKHKTSSSSDKEKERLSPSIPTQQTSQQKQQHLLSLQQQLMQQRPLMQQPQQQQIPQSQSSQHSQQTDQKLSQAQLTPQLSSNRENITQQLNSQQLQQQQQSSQQQQSQQQHQQLPTQQNIQNNNNNSNNAPIQQQGIQTNQATSTAQFQIQGKLSSKPPTPKQMNSTPKNQGSLAYSTLTTNPSIPVTTPIPVNSVSGVLQAAPASSANTTQNNNNNNNSRTATKQPLLNQQASQSIPRTTTPQQPHSQDTQLPSKLSHPQSTSSNSNSSDDPFSIFPQKQGSNETLQQQQQQSQSQTSLANLSIPQPQAPNNIQSGSAIVATSGISTISHMAISNTGSTMLSSSSSAGISPMLPKLNSSMSQKISPSHPKISSTPSPPMSLETSKLSATPLSTQMNSSTLANVAADLYQLQQPLKKLCKKSNQKVNSQQKCETTTIQPQQLSFTNELQSQNQAQQSESIRQNNHYANPPEISAPQNSTMQSQQQPLPQQASSQSATLNIQANNSIDHSINLSNVSPLSSIQGQHDTQTIDSNDFIASLPTVVAHHQHISHAHTHSLPANRPAHEIRRPHPHLSQPPIHTHYSKPESPSNTNPTTAMTSQNNSIINNNNNNNNEPVQSNFKSSQQLHNEFIRRTLQNEGNSSTPPLQSNNPNPSPYFPQ